MKGRLPVAVALVFSGLVMVPVMHATTPVVLKKPGAPLRKFVSPLPQIIKEVAAGSTAVEAVGRHAPEAIREGKVQVVLGVTDITPELLKAVGNAKADVVTSFSMHGLTQLTVRTNYVLGLPGLANRPEVRQVFLEPAATTQPQGTLGRQ